MTITLESIHGAAQIARVYETDPAGTMPPIDAVCVLEWEAPRIVWVKALKGRLSRRTLRELLCLLVDLGVHTVRAQRAEGHVLPGGVDQGDGTVRIDVRALAHRFASPGASGWADTLDAT